MDQDHLLYRSEDEVLLRNIAHYESKHREMFEPPTWLKVAESPFKWLTTLQCILLIHWDLPEKLKDYKNQGPDYGFEKFTILLALAVEKTMTRLIYTEDDSSTSSSTGEKEDSKADVDKYKDPDVEKTRQLPRETEGEDRPTSSISEENEDSNADDDEYKDSETIYVMCEEVLDEMVEREGDIMYNRIGPAFHHVLQAMKAHELYLLGQIAKSKEMAENIQLLTEMSPQCQAGIEGIKAKFVMTVYRDVMKAMESTQKAMELDPYFAAWKYLTGKIIRRYRREYIIDITEEELGYFEQAVELERNPKYLVFLAQAYQEMAKLYSIAEIRDYEKINSMLSKAIDLYRECWSLKNDSAAISRRIGNGMMKIDKKFRDVRLAKEALLKAIELSPNPVTYHALGKLYYLHEKDDEKALEYFGKTEKSFGLGEIIRLKLIKDPNFDPYDYIKQWEVYVIGMARPEVLFSDIAFYYLYFKKDLYKAAMYIWKILQKEKQFFRVTEYHSYVFFIEKYSPINLLETVVSEILVKKQKSDLLSLEKTDEMKFLEEFLEKVFVKYPYLHNTQPKSNLQFIQKKFEGSIKFFRDERYGCRSNQQDVTELSWRSNSGRSIEPSTQGQETNRRHYREGTGYRLNRNFDTSTSENSSSSEMSKAFSMRNTQGINSRGYGSPRQPIGFSRNNVEGMTKREGENYRYSRENVSSRRSETGRQHYNYFSNNRYDTTVTDWRSENEKRMKEIKKNE